MPAVSGRTPNVSGPPVPTRTSVATQMPPSSKGTVVVQAHTRAAPSKVTTIKTDASTGRVIEQAPGKTPYVVSKGAPINPYLALLQGSQLTSAQLQAQEKAQATASLLPQSQALTQAQTSDAATAKAQEAATTGYYAALASALQKIAPQVNAGYQTAATNDNAFSQGYSDALAHLNTQQGTQDAAMNNLAGGNTPTSAATTAQAALPTIMHGLTGVIPATGLASEGAAFGAAASAMPATATGLGGQQMQRITQQELANQAGFSQQKAGLAAQIPGLETTYGNQILTQQDQAQQKVMTDMLAAGINPFTGTPTYKATDANKTAGAAVTRAKTGATTGASEDAARTTTTQDTTYKTAASQTRANGFISNAAGQPILKDGKMQPAGGYSIDSSGNLVKDSSGASATLSAADAFSAVKAWTTGKNENEKVPLIDPKTKKQAVSKTGVLQWQTVPTTIQTRTYQDQINGLASAPGWNVAKATKVVDGQVPMGTLGRPWTGPKAVTTANQFAQEGAKNGLTAQQTIAKGRATGVLPDKVLLPAVKDAFTAPKIARPSILNPFARP